MNRIFRLDLYADDWPSFHVLVSAIGIQIRSFEVFVVPTQANFVARHQLFPFQLMEKKVRILEKANDSMHIGTRETGLILTINFIEIVDYTHIMVEYMH